MKIKKQIKISEEEAGTRLDLFLANQFVGEFSRSQIQHWVHEGEVELNQNPTKSSVILKSGDEVAIKASVVKVSKAAAEDIPLEVIYEDKDLLVVNKPAGMVVHPGSGNAKHTLVNALLFHIKKLSKGSHMFRPGIVHRLDKDTSGLLVVAKNDWTHQRLSKEFKDHTIQRRYWVIVRGIVEHDELSCEESLARSPLNHMKVIVEPVSGKPSQSFFYVKERFRHSTLLEAKLETGRTHQIRVHLKHLGYPVWGDKDYGIPSDIISRQALHAKTLAFIHPRTGKALSFESKLPPDFLALLKHLRSNAQDN